MFRWPVPGVQGLAPAAGVAAALVAGMAIHEFSRSASSAH